MFGTTKHANIEDGQNHVSVAWTQSAAPTGLSATDNGKIWWDTDTDLLYLCTDGTTDTFVLIGSVPNLIKGITVENPTSSENITMFFTDTAITISQITSLVQGTTPSVTFSIQHGADRSSGTEVVTGGITETSTTTGTQTTSFDDATIPANSWVWITTNASSGTVTELSVSIEYTED